MECWGAKYISQQCVECVDIVIPKDHAQLEKWLIKILKLYAWKHFVHFIYLFLTIKNVTLNKFTSKIFFKLNIWIKTFCSLYILNVYNKHCYLK